MALDLSGVFDLEYSALVALIEAEKRLGEGGVSVWLVGLSPGVLEVIQRSSLGGTLGRERMHFNLEIAVREYLRSRAGATPGEVSAGQLVPGAAPSLGGGS